MIVPTAIHQYEIEKIIGNGGYSTICKCLNIENGQTYAMKISPKLNINLPKFTEFFQREINAGAFLQHKNIVSLHDFFWDSDNFYLIEDYCSGGDLLDFIQKHELTETQTAKIFKQIIKAVQYCHEHSIAHRDLKLENILLTTNFKIKIGDFGLCTYTLKDKLSETFCGSFYYISPEIICQKQYDAKLSDIWSLGVILYTLSTRTFPWNISNIHQTISSIRKCLYDIPEYISKPCADLISKMMKSNPNERISLNDALRHPFLMNKNKTYYKKLDASNDFISIEIFSKLAEHECQEREKLIYSPFNFKNKIQLIPHDHFKEIFNKEEKLRKNFEKSFSKTNSQKSFKKISLASKANELQYKTFKAKSPKY